MFSEYGAIHSMLMQEVTDFQEAREDEGRGVHGVWCWGVEGGWRGGGQLPLR